MYAIWIIEYDTELPSWANKYTSLARGAYYYPQMQVGIIVILFTGLKEDYYSREMGERIINEERDRQDRAYRNGQSPSSPCIEGRRGSHSAKMGQQNSPMTNQQNPNFGYVRRSTGCGIGSSGTVSSTKYSIPVYGNNGKMSLSGMKDMLTPEEFKAAHAALAIATGSGQSTPATAAHHPSPYAVITATSGPVNSPKTRTKVKVSGGTQTPNDMQHEMAAGRTGRHSSLGYPHPHQYGGPHSHHDMEYASSVTSSRNSGSYSSRYDPSNGGGSGAAYKSLSLTTPTATQLSQSLRERILGSQSLPKGATAADYAALLAAIQAQNQQIYGTPNSSKDRMSRYLSSKMNDGSLSDYCNYSEIQGYVAAGSNSGASNGNNGGPGAYSWMRHSTGYASSITSAPTRLMGGGEQYNILPCSILHSQKKSWACKSL